jgi:hypothetical protein
LAVASAMQACTHMNKCICPCHTYIYRAWRPGVGRYVHVHAVV